MSEQATPASDALYPNVPYAEYAVWRAQRSSVLKHAAKSASHVRLAEQRVEEDPTKATELGVGVHCAILEPHRFERAFTRGLRRSKRGRLAEAAHAAHALEQLGDGRQVIDDAQYEKCLRIREQLLRKPWRGALLDGPGIVELSALWTDDTSGLRCKARMDRVTLRYQAPGWPDPAPVIVELKSAQDATREGFRRAVSRYGYALQARMQLEALAFHDPSWLDPGTLEPRPEQYLWLVLETAAPWEARLLHPTTELLEHGALRLRHALAVVADAERTGVWPGFPDEPESIDLAPWEYKSERERAERWDGEPRLRHEERHKLEGTDDDVF